MLSAISDRRSIRTYQKTPVPKEAVEAVLRAGTLAPSSKNRQPWEFVVTAGRAKEEMLLAMERGLMRERERPLLPESARYLGGAEYTLQIMARAPVVILVVNPLGLDLRRTLTPEERVYELCNAQSIGACIENMSLASVELGLGSLWICDIYFAYDELCEWLGPKERTLAAALALGYPGEAPLPRPRKPLETITEWRG